MKKNNKILTLVLFFILLVLIIVLILLPQKRNKRVDVTPDEYKQEVYDKIKSEIDEENKIIEEIPDDKESNEDEAYLEDDELLKIQN